MFGCRYLGGRAASAPQVRKGESSRLTMAQADVMAVDGSGADLSNESDGPPPIMPHLRHSATTLDLLYPKVEAPDDDMLDDLNHDAKDGTFQFGLKIANQIAEQSAADGRRRRPAAQPQHATAAAHDCQRPAHMASSSSTSNTTPSPSTPPTTAATSPTATSTATATPTAPTSTTPDPHFEKRETSQVGLTVNVQSQEECETEPRITLLTGSLAFTDFLRCRNLSAQAPPACAVI